MITITPGLPNTVDHMVEDIYFTGASAEIPVNDVVQARREEIIALIRAEAINLADKIIGKDTILHNLIDAHGEEFLDPSEKAIFDFQVKQRIELAKYQNEPQVGPSGPVQINNELSENEA